MSLNPPSDLRGLNLDDLRRAVAIYLSLSYPSSEPSEAVRRRTDWPDGVDPVTLLSRSPFERASKADSPPIHALRLGNARYPHMKLQIQPWPTQAGYMLSVNTHDQVLGLDPTAADAEAFRVLQAENARIKEAIEVAWDEAGLPTFLRYLRDYLKDHSASA
ncbi:MAG: hypothetical protein JWN86_3453 [Planctomycetota bacterium]|nr:hypothetical protein [Planctomycetota bacterium]